SNRAASATASSPAKPTRMSSAVRQRSTRSSSVSMMSCAAGIRSIRLSLSGICADRISPSGGISAGLLDGGAAEEVPDGREEVRLRVDAVLRAELEQLRPERGDEIDVHRGLAGELADDARELADHARRSAARVHLEAHLPPLRRRLERGDLERDELRLA